MSRLCEHPVSTLIQVPCPYGHCTYEICPIDRQIIGEFGAVTCPCAILPGRTSIHLDGRPDVHPPMKAVGRHGSRIARSRRRHQPPQWAVDLVLERLYGPADTLQLVHDELPIYARLLAEMRSAS